MNLAASLFPDGWHGFVLVLAGLALYVSLRHAPWSRLKEQTSLHAALGFAVGLALIWSLNAGVKPGLSLHLLGAMAANLMFGPRLAVAVMALTLTAVTLNGAIEWQAWPINFVLMVAAPVFFAWCLFGGVSAERISAVFPPARLRRSLDQRGGGDPAGGLPAGPGHGVRRSALSA
jgi:uncharacterized membrane protein